MSHHCSVRWVRSLCLLLAVATGCTPTQPFFLHEDGDLSHYLDVATEISYPDIDQKVLPDADQAHEPLSTANPLSEERWPLSLEEALSIAMQNSQVIRSIGQSRVGSPVGQQAGFPSEVLTGNPDFANSIYDVAIQETSNTGPEAALANFDTQWQTSLNWERTDREQNVRAGDATANTFFARVLERDGMNYQSQLSKRTPSGTQFFWRNITTYDSNNRPLRELTSEWFTSFEMEARHPLLRNSGVAINRVPIILARINTDVAIADFEITIRDFVLEVERTYWNLYFQYQNLDAAKIGFESARETWKQTDTRREGGLEGGDAASVAQAAAQYYDFRARVEQAQSDLFHAENQLRFLMGIGSTDGRLIQPTDRPTMAEIHFDWVDSKNEMFVRSPELRRQRWRIKQNQVQLLAARNQLLPQFDAIALYRFLGLGDDLYRLGSRSGRNFIEEGSLALDTLTEGRFQEWTLGFQGQMNLGFRAELAQVRNQQVTLRRNEKRLEDIELTLANQLSAAVRRLQDQYQIAQSQYNTWNEYSKQVEAARIAYEKAQTVPLDLLLDAQSRQATARVNFHRALTEYNLAIVEVHYRKGSLLEHNGVALQEGPWPGKAYFDAETRGRQRDASYYLNYGYTRPSVVSRGPTPPYWGTTQSGNVHRALNQGDPGTPVELTQPSGIEEGMPVLDSAETIPAPTGEVDPIYGDLNL